jgi:hypothetical protein
LTLRSDESEDTDALTLTLSVNSAGHDPDLPGWVRYFWVEIEFVSIAGFVTRFHARAHPEDGDVELAQFAELNVDVHRRRVVGPQTFSLSIGRMIARQSHAIQFLHIPPNDTTNGSAV